jgi:hypothetical protein
MQRKRSDLKLYTWHKWAGERPSGRWSKVHVVEDVETMRASCGRTLPKPETTFDYQWGTNGEICDHCWEKNKGAYERIASDGELQKGWNEQKAERHQTAVFVLRVRNLIDLLDRLLPGPDENQIIKYWRTADLSSLAPSYDLVKASFIRMDAGEELAPDLASAAGRMVAAAENVHIDGTLKNLDEFDEAHTELELTLKGNES